MGRAERAAATKSADEKLEDNMEISDDEEAPKPSGKRPKKNSKKVKKSKVAKRELSSESGSSGTSSSSGTDTSDDEIVEKKSTTTKMIYQGFLDCGKFLRSLSKGPRSSMSALNTFIDGIEELPDNLGLDAGKAFRRFVRDLEENVRVLGDMVEYEVEDKNVQKKLKSVKKVFKDLYSRVKPSKRKGCLRRVISWFRKPSTQKIL